MTPSVSALFRYPVKALAGESLQVAALDRRGLVGDRAWAVHEADGRLSTGKNGRRFRRRDGLFDLRSHTDDEGVEVVLPDGRSLPAGSPDLDAALSAHLDAPVRMRHESDGSHFDDSPVSLVGTASLVAAGELVGATEPLDPRRFRANLVVETQEPFEEETWLGRRLRLGTAVLAATERIERCRMVDIAQVGVPARHGVLRTLGQQRDTQLAVYLTVVEAGEIRVGDELRRG